MRKLNRTLLVYKYLWENTDDEHHASVADIAAYLAENDVTTKDNRTIQADITDLINLGLDVIETRRSRNEYHIGSRVFDVPEVKLLIDAVQSSRVISTAKSKELIRKLSALTGPHNTEIIKRQLYVDQRFKSHNESVFRIVDALQEAIAQRKKVSFQYFDYSPDKKRVARHGGQVYLISPYSMLWNGDNYYLVGYSDQRQAIQTFRIDRIEHLSVKEEARVEPPEDYNVKIFFSQHFSMLGGETCRVELLVENHLMNSIIDRFGEEVDTEIVDDAHFLVRTTVSLSTMFYGWVFSSKGKIQILRPEKAICEFRTMIRLYDKN